MEKIKKEISQLSNIQKVKLFEYLRDDLRLKTPTEMSHKYGKSYGGTNKFYKENIYTNVSKTTYFVDND